MRILGYSEDFDAAGQQTVESELLAKYGKIYT